MDFKLTEDELNRLPRAAEIKKKNDVIISLSKQATVERAINNRQPMGAGGGANLSAQSDGFGRST